MKGMSLVGVMGTLIFLLAACNPEGDSLPQSTVVGSYTTPNAFQEQEPFPLSDPGPFFVGTKIVTLVDESRGGWELEVVIKYPALEQTDADGKVIKRDAVADMSGAPYPLILTGTNSGRYLFKSHLASYGFVMATVPYPPSDKQIDIEMIDDPLHILFTLDQLASAPPEGLDGVIDADHAGVAGYSSDGDYSLAMGGVRIDPVYYLSQCEKAVGMEPPLTEWWIGYICFLAEKWETFVEYVGDEITAGDDGLWQPVTDERIQAVMPMAPSVAWFYGERGLATANRPAFMICGTEDDLAAYQSECAYIFEHLGTSERYLVSFIGKGHFMVTNAEQAARINHFATAFFGNYLQGREEYAHYFSEEFVEQFDDLAWGVYEP